MNTPGVTGVKTVNFSRPQLQHIDSRQSISASDDFYSFSDQHSTRSTSNGSKVTVVRYATPQSRHLPSGEPSASHSPANFVESEQAARAPVRRPTTATRVTEREPPETGSTVRFGENQTTRITPRPAEDPRRRSTMDSDSAPTPGVDDMPYIRFAIDQLTRDEEVTGGSRHGSVASDDYPVERFVPDEGLGYYPRSAGAARPPDQEQQERRPSLQRQDSQGPDLFVAVDKPDDRSRYPDLDYVPIVLRPWALALVALCCLLMIAGIVFCNVWSKRRRGLWNCDGLGGSRYFVFQFLPQLLAILIIVWMFVVQAAVYRTIPFAMMAVGRRRDRVLQDLPILSRNFVLPDFSHFQHGEASIGVSLFLIWLANFIAVPLQSCLFQAKYYIIDGRGTWRWTSVQAVGWALVAVYALLTIALLLLMLRFTRSWTGLMWDPVSLADLIPLIQRSNILHYFERSETAPDVRDVVPPRTLRLGYWRMSNQPDIFYGIGEESAPMRNPSSQQPVTKEKQSDVSNTDSLDLEQQRTLVNEPFERTLYSPFTRYRWTVWFLRDSSVATWIVIVFVLFIAFVVVSFASEGIERGFLPRLPTLPSADGFSPSNFVFSFVPSLIGTVLFLAWQPIDVYFRAVQPFADMSSPDGAPAERSLLLCYPSRLPLETTLRALSARHYKVAWTSFMGVASLPIPVLAGGVFQALYYPSRNQVRMATFLPAYYTLMAFCGLYALSFLIIWPRRKRYLPHDVRTLADVISFLYLSPLLSDKALRDARSKADLATRLVVRSPSASASASGERESESEPEKEPERPVYGFGIYRGRDGREHLGIDRLRRPGRPEMLISAARMK